MIGSDGLIVVAREGERSTIVSADGLTWAHARELLPRLARVDEALDRGGLVSIRRLDDDPMTCGGDWEGLGFSSLLSADLVLDDASIGTIYALDRRPRRHGLERQSRMSAFARHTALAVGEHLWLSRRTAKLAEKLEGMTALDQLVLSVRNFEEMTRALAASVGPLLGARLTGIMVWDEQRDVLQMMPGAFGADDETAASCCITADDPHSNSARVFLTGTPYMSNHAAGDPAILQDYVDVFQVERLISLPLRVVGGPIGVLHLANKPAPFTMEDLDKAEALAPRVATAVELARTMFRLRRQQQLEGVLAEVAVGIASGRSMQDLFSQTLFEELCDAVDASLVALVSPRLPPMVSRRDPRSRRLEKGLFEEARSEAGARTYVAYPRAAGDGGHAVFHAPVHLSGKPIATLSALRCRGEPFTGEERDSLARLANLAALAWAAEHYQQQRAELARLRERQRIADDLHDRVAQILFGAQINLEATLGLEGIDAAARGSVRRARALLLQGDSAIRDVIHQLSRPARADVAHRLVLLVQDVEEEFSIQIHLDVPEGAATAAKTLRRPAADILVKVAQEALANAAKHADPSKVTVRLRITRAGRLLLTVVDDGIGISKGASRRMQRLAELRSGLRNNGGLVRVSSGRLGGTKVTASVPL